MARNSDTKDLGAAKQILGIEIHRDKKNGKLSFSHENYVKKILEIFEMNKTKPMNVSLVPILNFLQVYVLVVLKKKIICLVYHMPM